MYILENIARFFNFVISNTQKRLSVILFSSERVYSLYLSIYAFIISHVKIKLSSKKRKYSITLHLRVLLFVFYISRRKTAYYSQEGSYKNPRKIVFTLGRYRPTRNTFIVFFVKNQKMPPYMRKNNKFHKFCSQYLPTGK